ncbi:MAG: saccharopine dehydrogenase NADP-binding domain-containing protein [Planctomycetota bacterium]|nr:saccharopine dehydrogenase NADP-binding domain-containing protein [Planctomycetota bacterium]
MNYLVLGAGRQGLAIAYDLGKHGEGVRIGLVDADAARLRGGVTRLRQLLPGVEFVGWPRRLTGADAATWMRGQDCVVSAMPYRFNVALAKAAVRARVSFLDLGGNTALVEEALELDDAAKRAGVTVVPDCGLAPGLSNVLASIAVAETPRARHVKIRCGGLPLDPERRPLGYSVLFDIAGLTNEYTGEAIVLRGGKVKRIEAFTECEPFRGPARLGALEAFLTSGGTSTAPKTFRGTLQTYDYKTVRYAGHFEKMRAIIDLGLLELEPVRVGTRRVVPRDVFHAVAGAAWSDPEVKDLAILRVECRTAGGKGVRYALYQEYDQKTGFTAMEQTTGYPAAVIGHALARRELAPGARTPERCGFGAEHVTALRRRGLNIRRTKL